MPQVQSDKVFPLVWLVALLSATRFHHFETLPDASLAVFFLAGLFSPTLWSFVVLLAAAGLIDWLAIHYGGVSGWCVTAAYPFLLPTYGAMWLGGRLSQKHRIASTFAILTGSTVIAFLISNLSFYAFSGYFPELSLSAYALKVLPYLGPYLLTSLAYTALILAARFALKQRQLLRQQAA